MPRYVLEPVDLEHPDWESSSHKDRCRVTAPDEAAAREFADFAFRIMTRRRPDLDFPFSPWKNSERVKARLLDVSDSFPPFVEVPDYSGVKKTMDQWENIDEIADIDSGAVWREYPAEEYRELAIQSLRNEGYDLNQEGILQKGTQSKSANDAVSCPVCESEAEPLGNRDYGDKTGYDCPRCGPFEISGTALAMLENSPDYGLNVRARLSHSIRLSRGEDRKLFMVSSANLEELVARPLPDFNRQVDLLLLWLSERLGDDNFKTVAIPSYRHLAGYIGAVDEDGVGRLLDDAEGEDLIGRESVLQVFLMPKGLKRLEKLRNSNGEETGTSPSSPIASSHAPELSEPISSPAQLREAVQIRFASDPEAVISEAKKALALTAAMQDVLRESGSNTDETFEAKALLERQQVVLNQVVEALKTGSDAKEEQAKESFTELLGDLARSLLKNLSKNGPARGALAVGLMCLASVAGVDLDWIAQGLIVGSVVGGTMVERLKGLVGPGDKRKEEEREQQKD